MNDKIDNNAYIQMGEVKIYSSFGCIKLSDRLGTYSINELLERISKLEETLSNLTLKINSNIVEGIY